MRGENLTRGAAEGSFPCKHLVCDSSHCVKISSVADIRVGGSLLRRHVSGCADGGADLRQSFRTGWLRCLRLRRRHSLCNTEVDDQGVAFGLSKPSNAVPVADAFQIAVGGSAAVGTVALVGLGRIDAR